MERFQQSVWEQTDGTTADRDHGLCRVAMLISAKLNPRRQVWDMLNTAGVRELWQARNSEEVAIAHRQLGRELGLIILDMDFPAADTANLIDYFTSRHLTLPIALLGNRGTNTESPSERMCGAYQPNLIGRYPKPLTALSLRSMLLKSNGRPRLRKVAG